MLLPRSCLPLAYLDTTEANGSGQAARLFSAHIAALEVEPLDESSQRFPRVLVAEHNGKSLYAIEQVRPGLYAQCRLGSWVTLSQLGGLLDKKGCLIPAPKRLRLDSTDYWWRTITAFRKDKGQLHPEERTGQPCLKKSLDLGKPGYITTGPNLSPQEVPSAAPGLSLDPATTSFKGTPPPELPQLPSDQPFRDLEDLLSSIRKQYMESLYKSKASLAYFAKGPLSRARAAFLDGHDAPACPHRLVEYLRTLIIPLSLLDQKYRDTLPTLVAQLPSANMSEGEHIGTAAKVQKDNRKLRKEKIGKDGLYPQEAMDISQWWHSRLESFPVCESAELRAEAIKTTLLEQRAREIYMQIIVILEVLAVENVLPVPSVEDALEKGNDGQQPQKKRRVKKKQDLSMILDLSVDKLCIWQSMAVEENKSSAKSKEGGRSYGGSLPVNKPDSDQLREFCVDVILPL